LISQKFHKRPEDALVYDVPVRGPLAAVELYERVSPPERAESMSRRKFRKEGAAELLRAIPAISLAFMTCLHKKGEYASTTTKRIFVLLTFSMLSRFSMITKYIEATSTNRV
jgi:hypothetical protein